MSFTWRFIWSWQFPVFRADPFVRFQGSAVTWQGTPVSWQGKVYESTN